jgi:hypothetical protein
MSWALAYLLVCSNAARLLRGVGAEYISTSGSWIARNQ